MKRILLIISIVAISAMNGVAQNIDSLQTKQPETTIAILSEQVKKLQHDYDYLRCTYDLSLLSNEIADFKNTTKLASTSLLINCYHGQFDIDFYTSCLNDYYVSIELLNSFKEKASLTKAFTELKIASSIFSEAETDILRSQFDLLDRCLASATVTLDYYKAVIDIYKKMR